MSEIKNGCRHNLHNYMSGINNPTLNYLLQKRNKIIWYETFKQLEIWLN